MIHFYRHDEIDPIKWDNCVAASVSTTWFAEYDILSVANPEWAALVKDDYTAVMPLPWRCKHGLRYVYNPFYYPRLGIFGGEEVTAEEVASFVRAIPKSFVSIDMNLNESNSNEAATRLKVSHVIDLSIPYEKIQQHYASNHKRNIKSARSFALQLDTELTAEEVIAMYRSSSRGHSKEVRMQDMDYDIFLKLCKIAQQHNILDVWGARETDGTLLAGAVFLRDRNRRVWFWASGRDEGRADRKAMFFLMDEYIQQHAHQPLELDFNGSSTESVARFYAGFGGERYEYPALSILHNPWLRPFLYLYRKIK